MRTAKQGNLNIPLGGALYTVTGLRVLFNELKERVMKLAEKVITLPHLGTK